MRRTKVDIFCKSDAEMPGTSFLFVSIKRMPELHLNWFADHPISTTFLRIKGQEDNPVGFSIIFSRSWKYV